MGAWLLFGGELVDLDSTSPKALMIQFIPSIHVTDKLVVVKCWLNAQIDVH